MRKMLQSTRSFLNGNSRRVHAVWMTVLFVLVSSANAFAQQTTVSGTVTSTTGTPLPGVTVRVQGTDTRVVTDASGKYRIAVPTDGVLVFSLVGQKPIVQPVSSRTTVDVSMSQIPYLEQVVVTAYTEQRRADITGAVASADVDAAKKQSGASIVKALDATVPGVTVTTSGSPGSRSTVRIRG